MKQKFFEPPKVEVIEIEVEQGFATSPTPGSPSSSVDDLNDYGNI